MTEDEFRTFLSDLRSRFPDIGLWIDGLEDTKSTLRSWFDIAFCDFTLGEATTASSMIQRGTYDYPRWKWQETPQLFRQIVAEIRQAETHTDEWNAPDGLMDYKFRCDLCRDTGLVRCWHVKTMAMARRAVRTDMSWERVPWYECGVVCSCVAGDKKATWHVKHGKDIELPRYNDREWVRLTMDALEDRANLVIWAENYQPPNRVEFGEYAGN